MSGRRTTIYGAAHYERLLSIPRERVLCIDVETTGLDSQKDEILQLAIVDGNGERLLCTYIHPDHRKRWPKAQEVNGITWQMVKGAPTLKEVKDEAQAIISSAELIIGYNVSFDQRMLKAGGIGFGTRDIYDVMEDYAQVWGTWSYHKGDYLWVSLEKAASHFKIPLDAHDAANDAIATARLFYAMLESDDFKAASEARDAEIERQREEGARQQAELEKIERSQRHGALTAWIIIALIIFAIIGLPLIFLASCVSNFS